MEALPHRHIPSDSKKQKMKRILLFVDIYIYFRIYILVLQLSEYY